MKPMPRILFTVPLILGGLAALSPAPAQDTPPADSAETPYSLERFTWQETLNAGQRLVVDNPWGDIRVRQTGDNTAIVHAVMQKIGAQPKIGAMKEETLENGHRIHFVYPGDQQPAGPREGRIDITVVVPFGVTLAVHADRGKVITKTMDTPLEVHATDAPVTLKSKHQVNVHTAAAPVTLMLLSGDPIDRGSIQTLSGNIEIRYYRDQAIAASMISGSSKTTNDLALLQSRRIQGRTVTMSKGDKPPHLNLKSDTGHIILYDLSAEHPITAEPATDDDTAE